MFSHATLTAPTMTPVPQLILDYYPTAQHHGFISGTHIATQDGWRAVEEIEVGDLVVTRDNDLQMVRQTGRHTLWTGANDLMRACWPVHIPADAMGNARPLNFVADQAVFVEPGLVGSHDFMAMLPAAALDGAFGIHRTPPCADMTLHSLYFAGDEAVYVDGGLLVPCPRHEVAVLHASLQHEQLPLAA